MLIATNLTIQNYENYGFYCNTTATIANSNITFSNTIDNNIALYATEPNSYPDFEHTDISTDNATSLIEIEEGTQTENKVWLSFGGNYDVSGNIIFEADLIINSGNNILVNENFDVHDNATLSIQPDVHLSFVAEKGLNVSGWLLAIGSEEIPITMTALDQDAGWNGIRFENNNSTAMSEISFCNLEYGNAAYPNHFGGAVYVNNFSNLLVSNCQISNNQAELGGGIYLENSSPTFKNNLITNNSASLSGGGIYCLSSDPCIYFNSIVENSAEFSGGGIYFADSIVRGTKDIGKIKNVIDKSSKTGNRHSKRDALTSGIFCNSIQYNSSVEGGGIYISSGITVKSNVITHNLQEAESGFGAGIYCLNSNPQLLNNTISDNGDSNIIGGGIYCNNSSPLIKNSIFWGNSCSDQQISLSYNSNPDISYCNIEDWAEEENNNISHDPDFMKDCITEPEHSYALYKTSICINGGDKNSEIGESEKDVIANSRITMNHGSVIVDIGAYEFCEDYFEILSEDDDGDLNRDRLISYDPSHVTCDLIILENKTMNIDLGITIEFQGEFKLDIKGSLIAKGKEYSKICFTADNDVTDNWRGIRLNRTDWNNTTAIFKNCIFSNSFASGTSNEDNNGGVLCIYNYIHSDQSDVIIDSCKFIDNSATDYGGAIYLNNSECVQVVNCDFFNNEATNESGGAIASIDSDIEIGKCAFVNNKTVDASGGSGGGIYIYQEKTGDFIQKIKENSLINNSAYCLGGGIYVSSVDINIVDNVIEGSVSNNYDHKNPGVEVNYSGGGIFAELSNIEISNNELIDNSSPYGGAIGCRDCIGQNKVFISNNLIKENSSEEQGSGIFCRNSKFDIEYNNINSNVVSNSTSEEYSSGGGIYTDGCHDSNLYFNKIYSNQAEHGGGLYLLNSSIDIVNNLIHHNISDNNNNNSKGGGLYLNVLSSGSVILNNTISFNNSSEFGSGLYFQFSSPNLYNNIIYENINPDNSHIHLDDYSSPYFNYCDIEDGLDSFGGLGSDNIESDPNFISESNFRLMFDSGCRDAGTNDIYGTDVLSYIEFDMDGRERVINSTIDIGAYEYEGVEVENDITEDTVWNGNSLVINNDIRVFPGVTLTISDNVTIEFINSADLIIDGATLTVGDNVTFVTDDVLSESSIFLDNAQTQMMDNTNIVNCKIVSVETVIDISNSEFLNSCIEINGENLFLNNNDFNNSYVYAIDDNILHSTLKIVDIKNCHFYDLQTASAIYLSSYPNFRLMNNNIENCETAIRIFESGSGTQHLIRNNMITANQYGYGIELYHSYANIIGNNEIENNYIGVTGVRNCNIKLVGNIELPFQIIHNNYSDELIFTHDSFPQKLLNNIVYDNLFDGFYVRCAHHIIDDLHKIDNNCWNEDPVDDTHFFPIDEFKYFPIWDLSISGDVYQEPDQELYELVLYNFEHENFMQADHLYKDLIENFPDSDFTKPAANDLLALYNYFENQYNELQDYYQNEPNLHFDEEISRLSDYLANFCNIKVGDYVPAIEWYENMIADPPSVLDSIYAVIDIGYIYLLMDEGRNDYIGRFPDLRPKSRAEFDVKRELLIKKLLKQVSHEEDEDDDSSILPFVLNQNIPNPFNPTTVISFSLSATSKVNLTIYNIKGQKVKTLTANEYEKGIYKFIWNRENTIGKEVSSGIYLYKLNVNGKMIFVKKCLMLK